LYLNFMDFLACVLKTPVIFISAEQDVKS